MAVFVRNILLCVLFISVVSLKRDKKKHAIQMYEEHAFTFSIVCFVLIGFSHGGQIEEKVRGSINRKPEGN